MPDCQLRIVLDRHDRTYRGGQTIAGRVVVSATGNVRCDGLRIERNWRTRGKGNTDSGPGDRHVLFRGQWQQGERYEYPFQFIAPAAPLSYHGRYIQIEHFVEAGADVPWAFDPKATEIITLRPGGSGGPVEAPPGVRWSPLMEQTFKTAAGIGGMVAGVMMFFLGVALFFPLGFVLVPAAIVLFTYSLLKQLVYQAVTVKVDFNPTVVPGQSAPLTLRVMPTKMLNITKVTARVRGLESCTSGSGKSRSHHRHAVHDQTDTLMESRQVAVGQTLEIRHDLKLPSTDALSFATMNNKITWELKLRIYIPMWPDWTQTIQLMVGPERRPAMEEAGASTADAVESAAVVQLVEVPVRQPRQPLVSRETPAPPRPPARRDAQRWEPQGSTLQPASDTVAGEDAVRQVQEPAPQPEPATVAAVVNPQPQVAADAAPPTQPPDGVVQALSRIGAADRFSGSRDRVVKEYLDRTFDLKVLVARVEWTLGLNTGEAFRGGRTAVGALAGSEMPVAIRFPKTRNDEIESLKAGEQVVVSARLAEWNGLHDRGEFEVV